MATKKDFVALAAALQRAQPERESEGRFDTWRLCVVEVACALRDTSERFDEDRFLRAAGVIDE